MPPLLAGDGLDLDDARAQVGQRHGRVRPGNQSGQVDDGDVTQNTLHGTALFYLLVRERVRKAAMPARCSGVSSSTAMCEDTMSRCVASAMVWLW